jgi:hypothetical protein
MARQGKIARLPHALRVQVNQRLLDGEPASTVLPWLNSQPDAIRKWEEFFEGEPCSAQNLSQWKLGGFKDWLKELDRVDMLSGLSAYSTNLVKAANGQLADGLAAMAAGEIMTALETVGNILVTGGSEDADKDPLAGLAVITGAIKKLQDGERKKEDSKRKDEELQLRKDRHTLSKKQLALAEEKFRNQTLEKLLEIAKKPEFQAILTSREPKAVQMQLLHKQLFGEDPTLKEGATVDV